MAYKVVMTDAEMVAKVKHICFDLATKYNNNYPYNLGYNHGSYFSWDCWNFYPKTLIWGWDDSIPVGQYQHYNAETGLGDWNGWTILNCCAEISVDFNKVVPAEFLLTENKGHAGAYVGLLIFNGKTYNVIECTTAFGGGVVLSWVDKDGTRRAYQGGPKNGRWNWHGRLPWIAYSTEPAGVLAVDGSWGMATTRYTQKMLGTYIDGLIDSQPNSNKKYLPGVNTTSWQFVATRNATGSNMIKALQNFLGVEADGKCGPLTVKALQKFLNNKGFNAGSVDGYMGAQTVKAWQSYVNDYFKNNY